MNAKRLEMKERPILFSGPMVRAILEGRKTQTRRVVKRQYVNVDKLDSYTEEMQLRHCPYGVPGDRLWVRETYLYDDCRYDRGPMPKTAPAGWQDAFYYRADGECCQQIPECACCELDGKTPWRPSIFMPRWASRITLEITDVRVQRLQDISEDDAQAEGAEHGNLAGVDVDIDGAVWNGAYRRGFHRLWDHINAKRGFGWDKNPWVWALTFKRVTP